MVNRDQSLPGADIDMTAVKAALAPFWRNGHRGKLFFDEEVMRLVIVRHRRVTIEQLREEARRLFGAERAPSKSGTQRFWAFLDRVCYAGTNLKNIPAQSYDDSELDLGAVTAAMFPYWRNGRRGKLFFDTEVLRLAIIRHREVTIDQFRDEARRLFGAERVPSRGAAGRFWQILDLARPDMPWLKTARPPPLPLGGA